MFTKTRKTTRLSLTPESLAAAWLPPSAYTCRPMTALRITKPKTMSSTARMSSTMGTPW